MNLTNIEGGNMRDEYDLSDAMQHSLAGQFKGKFTAIVHYDLNITDEQTSDSLSEGEMVVAETANDYSN